MVFYKNNYFVTYDENFKKLKEIHKNMVGDYKSAAGATINFIKNKYLGTYDKNFKKISERHI